MRVLAFVLLLFLTACKSTTTSESITMGVVGDLNSHKQAIAILDKQTSPECKTDSFVAVLDMLKAQVDSIGGQVENISIACQTEKQVLEEKINIRNVIISFLLLIIGYALFKKIRSFI